MAKVQIEIIEFHIFQGIIDLIHDMLAGKAPIVRSAPDGEEYFGRNDIRASFIIAECGTEKFFGFAAAVSVCAIEEIDARVVGGANALPGDFRRAEAVQFGHPASEGNLTDFESPFSEVAVLHIFYLNEFIAYIITHKYVKVNKKEIWQK